MAKQQSRTVRARHAFRKDSNGNPRLKTFTMAVWQRLSKIHQWVDGTKWEYDKMGWIEVSPDYGQPAPEPLKSTVKEKVQAPQPVKAPAPTPAKESGVEFEQ